jgi:4-hydroxy-tetrahydrodipicolinate synthase
MRELRGICTAIVTPFDQRGNVMLEALDPFLDFQRAAGIEGVVAAGTNGEGTSLSVSERQQLLEAVLARRGDLLVIAGTGAANLCDAQTLTRHASEVGADAALVLPPFFFKNPPAQGVAAYFRRVMDVSDIPVLLYSIPQQTAVPITDDILRLVDDHPRFAGLKDSAGVWERTEELIRAFRGRTVFPGSDLLLSRGAAAGAVGNISGTANSLPELIVGVARTVREGKDGVAEQELLTSAIAVIQKYPLLAANKSILAHRGLPRMWVRPPLIDLTTQQEDSLMGELRDLGVAI